MTTPPDQIESLLRNLPRVRPSVLFRTKLRTRLFFHAFRVDLQGHLFAKSLSFASAVLAVVLVFGTTIAIYDNPSVHAGSRLYEFKRVIEDVGVALTARSPEKQTEAHLKLAERRSAELQQLRNKVGQGVVEDKILKLAVDDYVSSTSKAYTAAKQSVDTSLTKKVSRVAAVQAEELNSLRASFAAESSASSDSEYAFIIVERPVQSEHNAPSSTPTNEQELTGSGVESAVLTAEPEKIPQPSHESEILENAAAILESIAIEGEDKETVVPKETVPVATQPQDR